MKAWILGGSSGLGLELVKEAERHSIDPVTLGRNSQLQVDLSDRQSVEALCQKIEVMEAELLKDVSFFVWNAGEFEYGPFDQAEKLASMFAINADAPTRILQTFVRRKKKLRSPFHLITIASVAVWKARADMAIYAGTKAYQAQFSRSLALEFERDLPGSKVVIVHPAGMKTGLFPASINTSEFMDPREIAGIIWREALVQEKFCDWFNVLRVEGKPSVSRENVSPELAYDELPKYNTGGFGG